MEMLTDGFVRNQLLERKRRLDSVVAVSPEDPGLRRLLKEIDSALERMDRGTYGLCEACHESIEAERLASDPLVRYCLDHLTPAERSALEQDLETAARMQRDLLPPPQWRFDGWEAAYHYAPLGAVSGDYCDVVVRGDEAFLIVGDAAGKGITASMLMSHLHAIFRTLIAVGLPVDQLVERASRLFCESTLSAYFATLVCLRVLGDGSIEFCNAGHCPPLLVQEGQVARLEPTGVPVGMFCEGSYAMRRAKLMPGDTLFIYTDGASEARSGADEEFGERRLADCVSRYRGLPPAELVRACLGELEQFLAGARRSDDLTLMALRRVPR
jgi:sigma-B regulation protein RsbU (phosphoserine phosphatase)